MILTFIFSLALAVLGLIIYFVVKASKYITSGSFDFKVWRAENLHKFIYSVILLSLLFLLFTLSPTSKELMMQILGIDLSIDTLEHKNLAPELIGVAVGSFVCKVNKSIVKK